jgi:RND superfamily putative drug exporter
MSSTHTPPSWPIRVAIAHPWRVIVTWIVVVILAVACIGALLGGVLGAAGETTNNPESRQALTLLEDHTDKGDEVEEVVIVSSAKYRADDPAFQKFLAAFVPRAPKIGVTLAGGNDPDAAAAGPPTSKDGHAVLLPLAFTVDDHIKAAERLLDAVEDVDRDPDFTVNVTGMHTVQNDLDTLSQRDLQHGELYVGLPVAMLVLLLVFGTVVGALLPVIVAMVAIICALALASLVGQQWELSVFLVNMVSGMGLALGIDYSLFVLSRYREERARGSERDAAIRTTGATASRAVLFSGITFIIALSGMLLVPTTIMRSLAAGAILVGITAVLAALTLLPALLRVLGDRVDSLALPGLARRRAQRTAHDDAVGVHGFWGRLVRKVMRRPLLWGGSVAVLLLVAALPLLQMETGASGVGTFPADLPSAKGYKALRASFPEQASNPARIVIHDPSGVARPEVEQGIHALEDAVARDDRFGTVTRIPGDDELTLLEVSVGADSLSTDAVAAVRTLRSDLIPKAFADAPDSTDVLVTGDTALNIDYFDVMRDWLPIVLAFVLGLSFLILLVVFRSLVVPFVAIALNLLSVGATYGLLVLVFQHGVGATLFGFRRIETTEAWVPLFLFSVLFGLSMDYHMFLMTRIRERWAHSGDTREAVAWAVGSTGRIITGAALIIVAVFVGFAVGDLVMFQQMGFGIAVALLIDATLVRGVLLPAAMALLGEHNWYLPRWLEWLPEVQLEEADQPAAERTPS